jgi:hypothetical protein
MEGTKMDQAPEYDRAIIPEGKVSAVRAAIEAFLADEPKAQLIDVVGHLEENPVSGVDRVDGYCVEPIFNEVTVALQNGSAQ